MNSAWATMGIADHLPELWQRTGEHILLTGCSTFAAITIGIPLGVLLFRNNWLRNPVIGVIGILQTIPSLAMLAFLLALLSMIGTLPALIALTLYALLPIVRNTLTGLMGVPADVMEAARGMGMTPGQRLRMVRIPLAAPVILAGVRTAAVVGVGIATLSAFIGAGGLGQFINRGLALADTRLILLGAVPSGLLALIVDFVIAAFGWGLSPEKKRDPRGSLRARIRPVAVLMPFLLLLLGAVAYLSASSFGTDFGALPGHPKHIIRIGTKNFTEQLILGEMMAQMIEAKTDLRVERRFNLGGTMICHNALRNGEIDLYAEYTGTGLTAVLKAPVLSDPDRAYRFVKKAYQDRFQLSWLPPFGFNNTYALTVRSEDSDKYGWSRISDLREAGPGLKAGFTAEFSERVDGYRGLRETYGLTFGEVLDLDPSLMVEAIAKGQVDVICAFATDGRIAAYDLKPLKDDLRFFPPYYAAPVIRGKTLQDHPQLLKVLSILAGRLDDHRMQRLNYEVDGKKQNPADVARSFLKREGITP